MTAELNKKGISEDDIMMNSVTVKVLSIKWLKQGNRNFMDLVQILNDTKNAEIYPTSFVRSLLSGYWDRYYLKIFNTQFRPFVIYMTAMISFLVYALQENIDESANYSLVYFPLLSFCSIFIFNQAMCEFKQWHASETNADYFLDFWNMNDLVYLVLNIFILTVNFCGDKETMDF